MTRAAERPTTAKADDMADLDSNDGWHDVDGETPESSTTQVLNLAHRAIAKFPDLTDRYKGYAGPAVIVSGALVALAGVAVARRLRRGQQPDQILEQITSEEIERAADITSRQNRLWRMVKRVAQRRSEAASEAADE